jgi:hypothetical protein
LHEAVEVTIGVLAPPHCFCVQTVHLIADTTPQCTAKHGTQDSTSLSLAWMWVRYLYWMCAPCLTASWKPEVPIPPVAVLPCCIAAYQIFSATTDAVIVRQQFCSIPTDCCHHAESPHHHGHTQHPGLGRAFHSLFCGSPPLCHFALDFADGHTCSDDPVSTACFLLDWRANAAAYALQLLLFVFLFADLLLQPPSTALPSVGSTSDFFCDLRGLCRCADCARLSARHAECALRA